MLQEPDTQGSEESEPVLTVSQELKVNQVLIQQS